MGVNLPLADLIIGACALQLGYAVATSNVRDFLRIPGSTSSSSEQDEATGQGGA